MTDKLKPWERSWNMSRIRAADTRPEILLRSVLHRMGFRFRLHVRELPGRPDIVLPRHRTVIFVQGCFWHQHPGCIESTLPKTNKKYWKAKLQGNVKRDKKNHRSLRGEGWRVFRFWECQIEKDPIQVALRIAKELRGFVGEPSKYTLPSRAELLKAAGYRSRFNRK